MTTLSIAMTILILALFIGAWLYSHETPEFVIIDAALLTDQLRLIAGRETAIVEVYSSEDGSTVEVETANGWAIVFAIDLDTGAIVDVESVTTPDGSYYETGDVELSKAAWAAIRDVIVWREAQMEMEG